MEYSQLAFINKLNAVTEATQDDSIDIIREITSTVSDKTNLTIDLITDKFIDKNIATMDMGEVTNPSSFQGRGVATPDGLFSPYIFGTTQEERRKRYGYIDLGCYVFHPYVYEILKKLNRKFDDVIKGQSSWRVSKDGDLEEVLEGEDGYDEENTGMDWLIKHFDEFKFRKNASHSRSERVSFITSLKKEDLFISKWLVIPIFYRDVIITNGIADPPEINKLYNKVIMYSSQLRKSSLPDQMHITKWKIQTALYDIRRFGQKLIEKKNGFFKRNVLGKNIDFGYRSVISVHDIQNIDKPADDPINLEYSGIPLSQCCVLFYPFIVRETQEILRQMFQDNGNKIARYKDGKFIGYYVLQDPMEKFTSQYLQKKINLYIETPGARFRKIHVNTTEGKEISMVVYIGRPNEEIERKTGEKPVDEKGIGTRALTWTDVLYMAAMEVCKDKHVYITRYPLNDYFGTFPSRVFVLSTVKTEKRKVNGMVYDHYPVIDPDLPESRVSILFNDTITMCNTYLKGLNGDFDGDQVTAKGIFSQEANLEAEKLMHSKKHFINIAGAAMRVIGNEATLTMYTLTRDPVASSGTLDDKLKNELIKMDPEDISVSWFTKNCTDHYSRSKGNVKARININSRVTLQPKEYMNKELVQTTAGRIIFNKMCIEGKVDSVTGFVNTPFTKKNFGSFVNKLSDYIMEDKLTTEAYANFIHYYSFFGLKITASIAPSFSEAILRPIPEVVKKRDARIKEIESNTNLTPDQKTQEYSKLENELTEMARNYIKDDPSMILFDSGARGNFGVEYKVMSIFGGLVPNTATGGHDVMTSNYMDGLKKEDIPKAGNLVVGASYPRSVATAVGGYQTKKYYSAYQSIVLDEPGTNCGSKFTIRVPRLTPKIAQEYMYQYIVQGEKNVCLTPENVKDFLGKAVNFRTPMGCLGDKICHVCAGDRFRRLGIENAGLTAGRISNSIMDKNMQAFHQTKVNFNKVDPDSLII